MAGDKIENYLEDLDRRLVDGHHNGPVCVAHIAHNLDDDGGSPGIQAGGGFIHEDDRGACDHLIGNGEALALFHAEAGLAGHANLRGNDVCVV